MTEQIDDFENERRIAVDVLKKAGDRVAAMKRDGDLRLLDGQQLHDSVATVSQAIEGEVLTTLGRIFPAYGVLSKTGANTDDNEFRWVLNPIDGTKNYARDLPLWGLSLALLRRNQSVMGVITIPDNNETYSASLGSKAYRNSDPIQVTKPRSLANAIIAITWGDDAAHREKMITATEKLVRQSNDVLSVGASSFALSWLAAGKVDAIVDNGDLWEFAAGFLIAKQMGAVVTEWDGSKPTYRERDFFTLVSTNQGLHDELVAVLKD